jgi:RNA polymerase sigma-70 factor, ECF subfamily
MERNRNGHSHDRMSQSSQPAVEESPEPPSGAVDVHQLFETYLPFVWRNLRRLGVPDSLVEDATQDVFLVVHRRSDTWSAALSTVETWLFGIVLRVARNYRRAQQRRLAWLLPASSSHAIYDAPALTDGPAEILARREAAAVFERAIAGLDEGKRALFLLVDVEQLPVPEAALALGINTNTAYWRLRKARLGFRRALSRLQAQDRPRGRGNRS